jgi:Holliday junction resolvase RusA-like endonuclease
MIEFIVYGTPQPAGSKVGGLRKDGRVFVRDAAKKSRPWKEDVARAAALAMVRGTSPDANGNEPLFDGPLSVAMVFFIPRPKGHYGKRGLRPSAPITPTIRPDVLKLARAVEDACTGVVWRDDAQIVSEFLHKHYGEPARVEVSIKHTESA